MLKRGFPKNNMAMRAKLVVATTTDFGGGAVAATVATSDDPSRALKFCAAVFVRFCNSITTAISAFGGNSILCLTLFGLDLWYIMLNELETQFEFLSPNKKNTFHVYF